MCCILSTSKDSMSVYTITTEDIPLLNALCYAPLSGDIYFGILATILRKSKWNTMETVCLNILLDKGCGKMLYYVFIVKGQHKRFIKYYGKDDRVNLAQSPTQHRVNISNAKVCVSTLEEFSSGKHT